MEKEISSGAMLGIVLIALAAIIGLGFGVFAIAKGTANTGVTNVQENLEAVNQSQFNDYDQTIVTGQQVKSAYQNFEGKNVAVLIATQSLKDDILEDGKISDKAAGIKDKYGVDFAKDMPMVDVYAKDDQTGTIDWLTSKEKKATAAGNEKYINYNTILADADNAAEYRNSYIYFDNNCFRTAGGFYTVDGKVRTNAIVGNLSKSGMLEFLPTSARFQSYLVKDTTGTTVGVAFDQIGSR